MGAPSLPEVGPHSPKWLTVFLDESFLKQSQLAYLNAVLAEGDAKAIVAALGTVARARGMSRVAERSGLGRESLYKALSDNGNPAFTTIVGVASALGYIFEVRAAPVKR